MEQIEILDDAHNISLWWSIWKPVFDKIMQLEFAYA